MLRDCGDLIVRSGLDCRSLSGDGVINRNKKGQVRRRLSEGRDGGVMVVLVVVVVVFSLRLNAGQRGRLGRGEKRGLSSLSVSKVGLDPVDDGYPGSVSKKWRERGSWNCPLPASTR
jgi:hypothetical protein